jgi:hypothetical protein
MKGLARVTLVLVASCGSGASSGGPLGGGSGGDAAPPIEPSAAASCTDGMANKWQNVTPPTVEALIAGSGGSGGPGGFGTSTIAADPLHPSTLYVSADGQGMFKSLDCGGHWSRVDDPSDGFAGHPGSVYSWALAVDPMNPQIIYANDGYGKLGVYKSTDGGQTFTETFTGNLVGPGVGAGNPVTGAFIYGGFVGSIRIDPTNNLHLLVAPHHTCNAPYPEFCLLESFDGASTWTVVSTNISVANADGPWADLTDATHFYVGGTPSGGLYLSTDGGDTWNKAPDVTGGVYGPVYHSQINGHYFLGSQNGVLESADGLSWSVIAGSPQQLIAGTLVGDGANMYVSRAFPGFMPSYYRASEMHPDQWTTIDNPAGIKMGGWSLYADSVNGFLYSSNAYDGVWRYSMK